MSIKKILAVSAVAAGLIATPFMTSDAEAYGYGRRVSRAAVRGAYYGGTPYYANRPYSSYYGGYSRPYSSYNGGYGRAYSPYYGNSYYRGGGYGYGYPGYGRSGVSIGIGGYPGYYGSGLRIGF